MKIKIANIQTKAVKGDKKQNLINLSALCDNVSHKNPDLICFPEMINTGYLWNNPSEIKHHCENKIGHTFKIMSKIAKKNKCYISYGFPENDNGDLYNSLNLIGRDGNLLINYRKVNLFSEDENWAKPGNLGYQFVDTDIGRIGVGICMDLNFSDFIEFHIKNNVKIFILALNWLEQFVEVKTYWKHCLRNYKRVAILSNTYGVEENVIFCGKSSFFNESNLIKTAKPYGDEILFSEFDI